MAASALLEARSERSAEAIGRHTHGASSRKRTAVSFMPNVFDHRAPRAIGNARAWHAAFTFLCVHLGHAAAAFAAELRARRAIDHLRSLDDDRLWDLGVQREDIERFVRFGRD
jgi:uncharacterized protein YjiS (DUF1127 family)